ncbi:GntR family transcriptional regulator [Facklamia miroungae]|uniref:GntR family transcriptional regulator n=1 Tax=Facklamia miroungae TaxID=120956 RepID=A0A1G7U169_9LACT|nr:GntR family transcriptional regulator [Facklamia miroungae]NKZ29858.1 GntR family transcriptional regulator [Facklamia miroungae]SDG41071.1 GntR family transcriptional regulator [Facklamia miroungae]
MQIIIDNTSMTPLYEQIVDQITAMILAGEIPASSALPSVRSLSKELKISALTVKKAYDQLEREGFIETVHGKGSYVLEANQELLRNEQLMQVETIMAQAIEKAQLFHLSKEEMQSIFDLLMGDWDVKS